jgi:hypothetical protein
LSFYKVARLANFKGDAKTIKSLKKGVLTSILYLAPHEISGYQVCSKASEGCKKACLYTSGHGRYSTTQKSRINKTKWFFEDRKSFMEVLVQDAERLVRKCQRENLIPAMRLNGTSDIPWEKFRVTRDGVNYGSVMEAFPEIIFYDYTKILGRRKALSLPNYHLTFSLSEDNDNDAVAALRQGYNVAVVMRVGRNDPKPKVWGGYPVVDGDDTDARFLDPDGGHVVALWAKEDARHDKTGFVREVNDGFRNQIKLKVA